MVPDHGEDVDPQLSCLISDLARRCSESIDQAGGDVVWLDLETVGNLENALQVCDGLLLLGGGDIDPIVYGEGRRHAQLYNVNLRSDVLDVAVVRTADVFHVPLLALCRGMHVVNVARGGTLTQHLGVTGVAHRGHTEHPMVNHDVQLDEASAIARILGSTRVTVRSGHHQAVGRIGTGLRPTGWAADGVVEALEDADRDVLAVQWHPEAQRAERDQREAIFGWLIEHAARRREQTNSSSAKVVTQAR